MTGKTIAGSALYISAGLPATEDEAGYAALTFTKIGEITNLGSRGRTYTITSHLPIDSRRAEKYKGSYDEGDPDYALAIDKDDAGQILANTANKSDDNYSFKEENQNGAVDYFQAKVTSFNRAGGGSDDIDAGTITVAINSDVVEVAAP